MAGRPRSLTPLDRFTEKYLVLPNGCWDWQATKARGYASFRFEGRYVRAARWAYEYFVGPIPDDEEIDHTCHSRSTDCPGGELCQHRACVNPAHLEPVNKTEHGLRSRRKVCAAGLHDLTDPANRHPSGRGCYACAKARMRQRYAEDPEYRALMKERSAAYAARRGGQ